MTALPILDGRRFGCTRCGNCCMEPGVVYLSREELERAADHLGVPVRRFKEKYAVHYERDSRRWYIDAMDGRGCPLLTSDRRCGVHPVKPSQCSSFPFWQELLDDAAQWEEAKRFCPGLDAPAGRRYTPAEILRIRAGSDGT